MATQSKYLKYVKEHVDNGNVLAWCKMGYTDKDLCEVLGVSECTLTIYKNKYPEFKDVLTKGKDRANKEVEASAFRKACGYYVTETTVTVDADGGKKTTATKKYIAPTTADYAFWLTNRMIDKWRHSHKLDMNKTVKHQIDFDGLEDKELKKMLEENGVTVNRR